MSDIDQYLNDLKSIDQITREEAVFSLYRKLAMQECGDSEVLEGIAVGIRMAYSGLRPSARSTALSVLSKLIAADDLHELVRSELGYSYKEFRGAHDYLFNILFVINGSEFGGKLVLGEYFDFDKQMAVAFKLLKESGSDALN